MFDTSWSEIFVMTGLCLALVGRKDLPKASRFAGTQVGRVVGLLQGARVRADRFAQQNELRQLQNELRAGLRELDMVKAEIAVAASSKGTIGRTLGATVSGVNRNITPLAVSGSDGGGGMTPSAFVSSMMPVEASAQGAPSSAEMPSADVVRPLAPRSHSVAAVAEDEWQKQGIGFKSRAEQMGSEMGGSKILSNLIQQSLIFDQHDRVVQEQQEALQSKVEDAVQQKRQDQEAEDDKQGGK